MRLLLRCTEDLAISLLKTFRVSLIQPFLQRAEGSRCGLFSLLKKNDHSKPAEADLIVGWQMVATWDAICGEAPELPPCVACVASLAFGLAPK